MATGPITQIADLIIPSIFFPYQLQATERKARLVQSSAIIRDSLLDQALQGGGSTFNFSSFRHLDNDSDRVSNDSIPAAYTSGVADPDPYKLDTDNEIAVRLQRNSSWSFARVATILAGADPVQALSAEIGFYWQEALQRMFIATMTGLFADNDAAPSGSEHTQYDLRVNVSGSSFVDGVTNFTPEAYIDAQTTMGDSSDQLSLIMVHSGVYARMKKNNLIDFIPDSENNLRIPTYMGAEVVVDDGMPVSSGVYESWLFGRGALRLGMVAGSMGPFGGNDVHAGFEIDRKPGAGNGGGADTFYSRMQFVLHPVGYKYAGSASGGGPTNASSSNNLANAGSWQRVYNERKQIKIARLITREA